MAVDLNDLIPRLQAEVNPPGTNLFPNAVDEEFLLHMQNGFWDATLDGCYMGYTVNDDGIVTPTAGSTDFSDELQQLVIFYAAHKIIRNLLLDLKTLFRAHAGPVEFETQQSANTLRDILADINRRKNILLTRLSDLGVTNSVIVDAVAARDAAMLSGLTSFTSPGDGAVNARGTGSVSTRYG